MKGAEATGFRAATELAAFFELFHAEGADLVLVLGDEVLDSAELVLCILLVEFNLLVLRGVFVFERLDKCRELLRLRRQLRLILSLKVNFVNRPLTKVLHNARPGINFSAAMLELVALKGATFLGFEGWRFLLLADAYH
jgi:hypothetical protein